ncbi:MAG: RNA polymerase sigma factor [Ruminiclostridium sp.]|nr:RNA polymerase sigma factor [Ruminiclostridium sp.]
MNDNDIIELYNARSENAISETDRKYGGACRYTARNILGSPEDTEECVNDTYLKVWNIIPPERPRKLCAFLMRIVRNLALDMCKKQGRLKNGSAYRTVALDEVAGFLPSASTVEGDADRKALLKAIETFLFRLPKEKRIMFVRRYFYCSTYAEIAEDLHMTENAVNAAVLRTREKLREHLEKEGIEI